MADNNKLTRRVVMDVKTGVLFGLAFDDNGEVKGARLMSEGPIVQDPNASGPPGMPPGMPGMPGVPDEPGDKETADDKENINANVTATEGRNINVEQ